MVNTFIIGFLLLVARLQSLPIILSNDNFTQSIAQGSWLYEKHSLYFILLIFHFISNTFNIHSVRFYANWCSKCHRMEPVWDKISDRMMQNNQSINFADIDCHTNQQTCNEFHIEGFPTLVFLENGKLKGLFSEEFRQHTIESFAKKMLYPSVRVMRAEFLNQLISEENQEEISDLSEGKKSIIILIANQIDRIFYDVAKSFYSKSVQFVFINVSQEIVEDNKEQQIQFNHHFNQLLNTIEIQQQQLSSDPTLPINQFHVITSVSHNGKYSIRFIHKYKQDQDSSYSYTSFNEWVLLQQFELAPAFSQEVSEAVLHVGKEQDIRRQIEKELENEEQQEQQQDEFIEKEKQQLRVCFGVIEGISTIPDKLNDNNEDKQVNTETKAKIEREKRFIDEFRRAANLTNNRQSHTSSSLQFFFTLVSTQHLPFFLSHFGIHKERRLGIPGEGINTQNESDGVKYEGNEKQFKSWLPLVFVHDFVMNETWIYEEQDRRNDFGFGGKVEISEKDGEKNEFNYLKINEFVNKIENLKVKSQQKLFSLKLKKQQIEKNEIEEFLKKFVEENKILIIKIGLFLSVFISLYLFWKLISDQNDGEMNKGKKEIKKKESKEGKQQIKRLKQENKEEQERSEILKDEEKGDKEEDDEQMYTQFNMKEKQNKNIRKQKEKTFTAQKNTSNKVNSSDKSVKKKKKKQE